MTWTAGCWSRAGVKLLAISGSARAASTNTALLRALADVAAPEDCVHVWADLTGLPVFSPDCEGAATPIAVLEFANLVGDADGLVISCPEYVHALPGGFKNAIDWLVSRDEIIAKPTALLHASHRGEDALASLRLVLSTVSERFYPEIFERFELISKSPHEVAEHLAQPEQQTRLRAYLARFAAVV